MRFVLLASLLSLSACAPKAPTQTPTAVAEAPVSKHPTELCVHDVACDICVQCDPKLAAAFKAAKDWCPEHDRPESQCWICNPQLKPAAMPEMPAAADVKTLSEKGEDVASLDEHAVPGKVTLFDFYADWCGPCRDVDIHVRKTLATRNDIAYRRLNVVAWETPLAKRHMKNVAKLPYVVVYGKDGKKVATVVGLDLAALDAAIAKGAK